MSNGYLREYALGVPTGLAIIGMMIVSSIVLWMARNKATPFNDHVELSRGNGALALERGAFLLGHIVAMAYVIGGFDPDNTARSLGAIALKDIFITVSMFILGYVVDWTILPKVKNDSLLLKGYYAVATAMAGAYLGLGLVLGAATVGSASDTTTTFLATMVFALLGLGVVIVLTRLHFSIKYGTNQAEMIQHNLMAPAIDVASFVLSISLLVSVGVAGDLVSWWDGLKAFGATIVIALLMMYGVQWILNLLMTRGRYQRSNVGHAVMVAFGRLALAIGLWGILSNVL